MEFKVPVIVNAKPKRTKQEKLVVAAVTRMVDVPEVTSDDAPVVVSSFFPGDENDDGLPIYREFREVGGRLYVDITDDGPFVTTPRLKQYAKTLPPFEGIDGLFRETFKSMQPASIKNAVYPTVTASEAAKSGIETFVDIGTLDLTDVDVGMLDRSLSLFDREASKLILVDGKMHLRERPPAIEVALQVSNRGNSTHVKPVRRLGDGPLVVYNDADGSGGFTSPLAFFQIDREGDAIAFAQSLGYPVKLNDIADITTGPDAAVSCNTASMTINAIAVDMNNSISWMDAGLSGRELLNRLSVNVMQAYHRLEAILPGIDDENVPDELVDIVEGVLALPQAERKLFVPEESILPAIRSAIQLWHDRPVDVSIAPDTWKPPRRA
ncbi:hypothetical protein HFN89_01655 [Rhizobium laguerreae]|nr:hypothetical protein [Rhizobium laguerreae]